jgi:hypothetical protein
MCLQWYFALELLVSHSEGAALLVVKVLLGVAFIGNHNK